MKRQKLTYRFHDPNPPEVAAALELSPFEPAIYVDSVGFDARRRRVEYAQSYYPAGSSRFLIEIDQ